VDPARCMHDSCGCIVPMGDARYCGPYCANAAQVQRDELPGGACACGHGSCQEAHRTEPAGPEVKKARGPGPA